MLKSLSKSSKSESLQKIPQQSIDPPNLLKSSRENSTNNQRKQSNSTLLKPQNKSAQNSRRSSNMKISDLPLKSQKSEETSPSKMIEQIKKSQKQMPQKKDDVKQKNSCDSNAKQTKLSNQSQQLKQEQQKQTSNLQKETQQQGDRSKRSNNINKSVNSNSSSHKPSPQNKNILITKQIQGSSQSQIQQQSQEQLQQHQVKLSNQEQKDVIQQGFQEDHNQSKENLVNDQSEVQQLEKSLNESISEQDQFDQIQQYSNHSEQYDNKNDEIKKENVNQYKLDNQQFTQKLKYEELNKDNNQSIQFDINQVNNQEIDLKIDSYYQKVQSQSQIQSIQVDKINYQVNQLLLTEGDTKQIITYPDQRGKRLKTVQEDILSNDAMSQIQFNEMTDGETCELVLTHKTDDVNTKNGVFCLKKQSKNTSSTKQLEIVIQDDQSQVKQIQSAKAQLYSQQFHFFNQNDRNTIQEEILQVDQNNDTIQRQIENKQCQLNEVKKQYQENNNNNCEYQENQENQENTIQGGESNENNKDEDINLQNKQKQDIENIQTIEYQTYQLPLQYNNIHELKNQDIGSIYLIQQQNVIIQEQDYNIQEINLNLQEIKNNNLLQNQNKLTQNQEINDIEQNINNQHLEDYNKDLRENVNKHYQQFNDNNNNQNKVDDQEESSVQSQGSKKSRITNNQDQEMINNSQQFHQNDTEVEFNCNDFPSQRTQEFGETQREIENEIENEIEQLSDSQKNIKKEEVQSNINNNRFIMTLNLQNLQGLNKNHKDDLLDTGRTDDSMINQLVSQDKDHNNNFHKHNSENKPLFKMKKQSLYINDIIQEKQESTTPDNYTRSINPTPKPLGSTKHQKNFYSFGAQEDLRFKQGDQQEKETEKDRKKKEYQQQKKLQIQSEKLDEEKIKELQKILSSKLEIKQQKENRILEQSMKIMEFQYTLNHIPDIQDLDGNIDSSLSNIITEFIDSHKRNKYKNISNMKDPQLTDLMRNKFQEILKKEQQKQQQQQQDSQIKQILDIEIKQKQQINFVLQSLFQEYKILRSKSLEINQELFISQQQIYEKMKKLSIREKLIPQLKQLDIHQHQITNDFNNFIFSQQIDFNEEELINFIQSKIKVQENIYNCLQNIRNIFKERINQIKEGEKVMQEQLLQNSCMY